MEGTDQRAQQAVQLAQQALRRDVAQAERKADEPCSECGGTRRVRAWDRDTGQQVEAECGECAYVEQG